MSCIKPILVIILGLPKGWYLALGICFAELCNDFPENKRNMYCAYLRLSMHGVFHLHAKFLYTRRIANVPGHVAFMLALCKFMFLTLLHRLTQAQEADHG